MLERFEHGGKGGWACKLCETALKDQTPLLVSGGKPFQHQPPE
jgi:hypothetical protein